MGGSDPQAAHVTPGGGDQRNPNLDFHGHDRAAIETAGVRRDGRAGPSCTTPVKPNEVVAESLIGRHFHHHLTPSRTVELDHRRSRGLRSRGLGKHPSLRPGPECQDGERRREEENSHRQTEFHSRMTPIVQGGDSLVACAVMSMTKSRVNGVQATNTAWPVALTTTGPTPHDATTESPIRPPSNWRRTSSILWRHSSSDELIAPARAPLVERRAQGAAAVLDDHEIGQGEEQQHSQPAGEEELDRGDPSVVQPPIN